MAEIARIQLEHGLVSVEIGGEFDLADAERSEQAIASALEDADSGLLLDLSDCEFIDSTGIHALIQADRRAREAGLRIAIAGSGPQVRRVFDLTGLAEHLSIFSERDAAVRFLVDSRRGQASPNRPRNRERK
jgi:anti-anti-sigma factor